MSGANLEARLGELERRGVRVLDPRQTWLDAHVSLDRIQPGAVLHPGTRLSGARTWLGAGAEVGTEGPATLVDAVFDEGASIASGYVNGAVLLRKASLGANAHVRAGTLLEEEASTAHAVGLKQTLLLAFVTLGSLINFCDCLMAGGTSRRDHSEVGSGYIHFNFTPWGKRGDKATPSLVGDVPRGVFLRERRIFLGGSGGLVGPMSVGFGSIAAAGQVLRKDVPENRLVLRAGREADRPLERDALDRLEPRASKNLRYVAELVALRSWYQEVRLARVSNARRPVIEAAIGVLESCLAERTSQLARFIEERGGRAPTFALSGPFAPCPLSLQGPEEHIEWVQSLAEEDVARGRAWLEAIVSDVIERATAQA
jgi:UDP-N-acetylglucosamine/UDP-N-acetylgalactosamine diphosphorylase